MKSSFALWARTWFMILLVCGSAWCDETVPRTVAERSAFAETSRHKDVLDFIAALQNRSPRARPIDFATTVEGRPLPAIVLAQPPIAHAADALASGKLIVLLIGNIHAGECDGKEALLTIARDLALDPAHPLLEHLVLLIVPNLNADGNERVASNNRPGQNGPALTGRRENAQGLDLNRDFVKLETPEIQSLVKLFNDWNPHVLIDCHTTNGSRHRYGLTFAAPHNPAGAAAPREFTRDEMLPEVMRRLDAKGLSTFYYGNFDRDHTRWTSFGHEPRYSIEYAGLRGRIAILAESYSYNSFRERVEATDRFLRECLIYLAERPKQVRAVIDRAAEQTVALGLAPDRAAAVPIRAKLVPHDKPVVVKGYERSGAARPSPENPAAATPRDYTVQLLNRCESTLDVPRPYAYVIPAELSRVADRLLRHGIILEQLSESITADVDVYRIDKLDTAAAPFQRHRLRNASVSPQRQSRSLEAHSYVVRTAQPLGNLAIYLLEPASDDGLVTWNFVDHVLRAGLDSPIVRIPAPTTLATRPIDQAAPAQRLTLDQIYGPDGQVPFAGTPFGTPRWLAGTTDYLERSGTRLMRTNAATTESRPFHDVAAMERAFAAIEGISGEAARAIATQTSFELSKAGDATLISHENDLYYYRFADARAVRLTRSPEPEDLASFSPDGKRVAFVRKHNLFVVDVDGGREQAITTEGNDQLFFGELDWVYQEELYGRGNFKGFWWSPDSSRIALLRLDESRVNKFTVVDHLPYRQDLEVTSYPKAGDPNPTVALGVADIAAGSLHWIDISTYHDVEPLIVRVGWTPDASRVVYQVQNRAQTWLDLLVADPAGGSPRRVMRESSPAWVEVLGEPHWLQDGSFLWLSDRSGSRHIYRISGDGQTVTPLTSGKWDVHDLYGVDESGGWVYFAGTRDTPTADHIYRVRIDGNELQKLSESAGHHAAAFDDQFRYFIGSWSDLTTPTRTWLFDSNGTRVRAIDPNLVDHLEHFRLKRPEFVRVPARDGFELEALLIQPPDFDPARKYPVLCYVYSGPQAPMVRNRWGGQNYLWHQMLAQRGYVVWICDNRSASTKGISAAWPVHRNLGENELRDIEDGLVWLKRQPWVDADRIGIWGWSYGGYMTSYALTHSKSFKIGIAGAPVTDWHNYDTIYTERYMGLPRDNEQGYRTSSVVRAAGELHGRLLLLHGTTDDNVHLSNTLQLAYELQKAGKQFDLMLYPKNRHGITNAQQLRHMRELMTRYVLENL